MAQALVAQPHREHQLAGKHRHPEFDVGVVAAEMPDVIVALADSAFDGVLQIDPAKRMFPGHPRDHAKIEAPPGVTAGHQADVRRERLLDKARIATGGAHAIEYFSPLPLVLVMFRRTLRGIALGRIGRRHREAAICDHRKKILGGADLL